METLNNFIRQFRLSPWSVWVCMAAWVFMATLDYSMLNLALPTIAESFHAEVQDIQWVALVDTLVIAVLLLPIGRASEKYGPKRLYTAGFCILVVCEFLAGFVQAPWQLVAVRALLGVGAASVTALGTAMLSRAFPGSLTKPIGFITLTASVGQLIGPLAAGVILAHFGWRWIFWLSLGFGLTALLWCIVALQPQQERSIPSVLGFDVLGTILSILSFGSLIYLLTYGLRQQIHSPITIGASVLCVTATGLFWHHIHNNPNPIISLAVFKRPIVQQTALGSLSVFAATLGIFFLWPFYFKTVCHFSLAQTGWLLMACPLGQGLTSSLSHRLEQKLGCRVLVQCGLFALMLSMGLASMLGQGSTFWQAWASCLAVGLSCGLFHSANSSHFVEDLREAGATSLTGAVTALIRNMGMSLGITASGLGLWWFSAHMRGQTPQNIAAFTQAYHAVCLAGVVFCTVVLLISFIRAKQLMACSVPAQTTEN